MKMILTEVLQSLGIVPPNPDTLPAERNGWRLCKIVQYKNNNGDWMDWLFTSSFNRQIEFRGKKLSFSTWIPGQQNNNRSGRHVSGWMNADGGWDDNSLMELLQDGCCYIYVHESGTLGALTPTEYAEEMKSFAKADVTSPQPTVQAG